jgi:vacuolar iron transporter family protein
MDKGMRKLLLKFQKSEIVEYHVYKKLSKCVKNQKNKKILLTIAKDELRHYKIWKKYTKQDVKPNRFKVWRYVTFARLFGLIFTLTLMERNEVKAQKSYKAFLKKIPQIKQIIKDEKKHEKKLLKTIHEEKLHYISSIVLGLNDALVEITGTLAGLTFALQNSRLIALVGLITGIAASMSMASSEYLSTKHEKDKRNSNSAAFYTGIAYFFTVLLLIVPFFVLQNPYYALLWTAANALLVILVFTYYISVAKGLSFKKRFFEMAFISLTVAVLSFIIGFVVRMIFGIDI